MFVNYLTYKTFEEAQSSTPVVLIVGSFFMTVGDHFKEHIITFDNLYNSNNEDALRLDDARDLNMQYVLEYICDLKYFSDICFFFSNQMYSRFTTSLKIV